ncbi:MAG: hypothetical protein U0802_23520 [Candidatus Binatia bacterium]
MPGQNFRAALIGDCNGDWEPGDPRGAQPKLAPEGTALVVSPLRRLRGGRWRVAVGLRSPQPVSSLEAELRYDASRLTPTLVRTAHLGDAALIDYVATALVTSTSPSPAPCRCPATVAPWRWSTSPPTLAAAPSPSIPGARPPTTASSPSRAECRRRSSACAAIAQRPGAD